MSPVAVPADRRFHRAHVKPARRRAAWRTVVVSLVKYGVLATLVGALVVRTHTFLTTSPRLAIARIEPAGNQRVSSEAIRAMLAGWDAVAIHDDLAGIPRVAVARRSSSV